MRSKLSLIARTLSLTGISCANLREILPREENSKVEESEKSASEYVYSGDYSYGLGGCDTETIIKLDAAFRAINDWLRKTEEGNKCRVEGIKQEVSPQRYSFNYQVQVRGLRFKDMQLRHLDGQTGKARGSVTVDTSNADFTCATGTKEKCTTKIAAEGINYCLTDYYYHWAFTRTPNRIKEDIQKHCGRSGSRILSRDDINKSQKLGGPELLMIRFRCISDCR